MTLAETSVAEEADRLSAERRCLDTRWSFLAGVYEKAGASGAAG